MDTKSPAAAAAPPPPAAAVPVVQEVSRPSSETAALKLESSPTNPTTPAPTAAVASDNSKETPATVAPRPPEPPSSTDADFIYIPSYSRWFSWDNIHESEVRCLPEFFDGRLNSKNPRVYKYYRNSVITRFRENPTRKITFTEARKTIIGDVGSIRRVFDFSEAWGLINYSPSSKPPFKWEDKDSKANAASSQSNTEPARSSADYTVPKKRLCSGCKTVCSIACFACDKVINCINLSGNGSCDEKFYYMQLREENLVKRSNSQGDKN